MTPIPQERLNRPATGIQSDERRASPEDWNLFSSLTNSTDFLSQNLSSNLNSNLKEPMPYRYRYLRGPSRPNTLERTSAAGATVVYIICVRLHDSAKAAVFSGLGSIVRILLFPSRLTHLARKAPKIRVRI